VTNRSQDVGSFLLGLVSGVLTGAALALILAPQSGQDTRAQIRQKGVELQKEVEQAAAELRANLPMGDGGRAAEQAEIEEMMEEAHTGR
jgi:gas vesicle protein